MLGEGRTVSLPALWDPVDSLDTSMDIRVIILIDFILHVSVWVYMYMCAGSEVSLWVSFLGNHLPHSLRQCLSLAGSLPSRLAMSLPLPPPFLALRCTVTCFSLLLLLF